MGTCIVRYLLEVTDQSAHSQNIRQLIGLGPPTNGSALAELFHDLKHGEEIINKLTGIFVPRGSIRLQTGSCRMSVPEAWSWTSFAPPVYVRISPTGSS